jgi:hypothetical protein
MKKEVERKQIIARLPMPLWKRARYYAVDTQQSFQAVLEQALEAYLKAKGAK